MTYRRDLLWTVGVILLLGAFKGCYDRSQQALGMERALTERLLVERGRWQQRADSLAEKYRTDSADLHTQLAHWQSVKRRVVERWRTDTLPGKSDTVLVPYPVVREIVASADSAIRQCLVTVATCEARIQAADSLLVRADSLVLLWRQRASPSLFRQLTDKAPPLAIGVVLGFLIR